MKKGKRILSILGINTFIAVKNHYNQSIGKNDFYQMINRREKPALPLAAFLRQELHYHYKETAQYQ